MTSSLSPSSGISVSAPGRRFLASLACAVFGLLGHGSHSLAANDINTRNAQIWKLKFGVTDAQLADSNWLNQDSDGDGVRNADEICAGTDPFSAAKTIRVTKVTRNGASLVDLEFPTEIGKRYRVQSTTTISNAGSWAVLASTPVEVAGGGVVGDGTTRKLTAAYAATTFYRILVDDLDSDSDGVSDWAERSVTLNHLAVQTVPGTNDVDYVDAQVALPNEVSIRAAESFASEDGPRAGVLSIERKQTLFPLTVNYGVSGTALAGTDYGLNPEDGFPGSAFSPGTMSGSAVFPAHGAASQKVFVNPTVQPAIAGSKSVTVALSSPGGAQQPFTLGPSSTATVIINDSTVPTGTGLLARYYDYAFVQMAAYSYTKTFYGTPNAGSIVVTPPGTVGVEVGQVIPVTFTSGNLSDPLYSNQNYTVSSVGGGYFTLAISGANLPANSSGNCEFTVPSSSQAGVINRVDPTVDNDWGTGIPAGMSNGDNFSVRWTGQVQPQFTEEYTFVVHADDGCKLWLDGRLQDLRTLPATNSGGSTYTYDSATGATVVNYTNSLVKSGSFVVGEIVRLDPGSGNLTHAGGSTYTYDGGTGEAVINYSNLTNVTPGGFAVGQTVEVDPTAGTLSPYGQLPYVITAATSTTFTVNFGTGVYATQAAPAAINISDNLNCVISAVTPTTYTVNFGVGKYANGSTGVMNMDIVNKPLKDFASMGNERYVRIPMVGGVRYDIRLDYYESTGTARCRLFWFSPSQPKQIIPAERLYPAHDAVVTPAAQLAPTVHVTPAGATALVGGVFSHPIAGSNGATVTLSGNPAWLTYNALTGTVGGTPPQGAAGDYQILITITNAAGTSTSVLNLHVEATGGGIGREYWSGVAGTGVANIPVGTTPTGTANLTSLEAPTGFGTNYGARIRGFITAPVTGNYYFWIAANNAAELWISNDAEPINAFKRAWVGTGSTSPQTWNAAPSQKSPWMALEQGRKYYIEILHKAGTAGELGGAGTDNLAVGWLKPGEMGTAPTEIVPGYVLSPYVVPAPGSVPGTLYVATMLAQGGAQTNGVGTATMRLTPDENVAYVKFDIPGFLTPPYNGLTGIMTDWHVHSDPYLTHASSIMYDPNQPPADSGPQPDGSHKWTIPSMVGTKTKAEVVELIKQGKGYINIHTAANLNGEIRGNFTLAVGSRTFTPPPPPPSWTGEATNDVSVVRFLTQATFGPNVSDIAALKAMPSFEAWIDDQFTKPASPHLPEVIRTQNASVQGGAFATTLTFNAWWWRSIAAEDQLRQRIAFALSEIHVVSGQGPLENNALALSYFYDKLLQNAFGNFRDILRDTTLTPSMGRYLDMLQNDKPDLTNGRIPNENYAREIKQLFSIGLYRMWPDGTLMLDSTDSPIDTYTQREIVGFAHAFTGWGYGYDGGYRAGFAGPADWTRQMREVPARHFTGPKRVLNNEVLPGLQTLGNQPLDPYATHNNASIFDPQYQALAAQELEATHDQLFNHPNVGPFICRQLIQRLVTSHPSRDYLYRVVQKFNDNGLGVRGDMKAVIKAILLDYEARSSTQLTMPAFGKQREGLLRVAAAGRAFRPAAFTGTYSQTGTRTITITAPAHNVVGNVFLDFTSGSQAPWSGAYGATVVNATTFTVGATGWVVWPYSIPAGSSTCTVTASNHWVGQNNQIYVAFETGSNRPPDGPKVVTGVLPLGDEFDNGNSFTFTVPTNASARSGNLRVVRFSPGSYTIGASGLPAPNDRRITMNTNFDHHLNVGDQVQLNIYGGNPQPEDRVVTVETVVDNNTYTALGASTGNWGTNQGSDSVYQFPLVSQPLTRSGNVGSRPSTFGMGSTTGAIDQSPLYSPTVFNYFLPDFKHAGTLASQGITTPEFETTSETTVVRAANYLFDGIFNPNVTNGYSSFSTGNNALVMDFSPWMGNATNAVLGNGPQTGQVWTSNANVSTLIDRMNTLLTAGRLLPGSKTTILQLLGGQVASITTGSPCTFNMSSAHGLEVGDSVTVTGISGGVWSGASTTGNGTFFVTAVPTTTSFRLATATTGGTNLNCTSTAGLVLTNSTAGIIPYTNAAPTTTNIRDRLRTIIHLILTSPDFTIQR